MNQDLHSDDVRLDRRKFLLASSTALTAIGMNHSAEAMDDTPSLFPSLTRVGNKFRVALIADTQVGTADARSVIAATTSRKMSLIVDEINALDPLPAFVLFDGDQVGHVDPPLVRNFLERATKLKPLSILVHGNHDGRFPYAEHKAMQREINGTDRMYFSWNVGRWHFVTIPSNIPNSEYGEEVLTWLEEDLGKHLERPTILFQHFHLLPQGLTQLEWYTYDKPFRKRCLQIIADAGNVRYSICGHVHNGIQTSAKLARCYRGTNYITAPTCTASRNFGEEFAEFQKGLPQGPNDSGGGYYLMLDFDDDDVIIRGRLAGCHEEFVFPKEFENYENDDPLWLEDLADLEIEESLSNGSFDHGTVDWYQPFRYIADRDPGFIAEIEGGENSADTALHLFCREKGQNWARDEMIEVFQRIEAPTRDRSTVSLRVKPDDGVIGGGGYLRICLFSGDVLQKILLVDWCEGRKEENCRFGANFLYTCTGEKGAPDALIALGKRKDAMFWTVETKPQVWNEVSIDVPEAIIRATGSKEEWQRINVDRWLISVGVWCLPDPGSRSGARFERVQLLPPSTSPVMFNGKVLPIDQGVFVTDFGRGTFDKKQREREDRPRRRSKTT